MRGIRKNHRPAPKRGTGQQQFAADEPQAPRIGEMTLQSGLAMQSGLSYPQKLVHLVGHRHCGAITWVRPKETA